MAEAAVRPATPGDAAEIARIQLSTWRTAYAELLPPEVLDHLSQQETEQQWQHTLEHGPAQVVIATEGPWTVGFCAAGPAPEAELAAPDGSLPTDAAEVALISSLLVEPRWGRRGHGGRLRATAANLQTLRGATRGIAWVPVADTASLSFFRSAGWEPDGTVRTLDAGGRPLREMRLSGSLEFQLK